MGLRCSLLGHDFGDVVVERDRDVRGEEIVVTERELRECRRCDAESIITENTEVRRKRPKDAERDESPAGGPGSPHDTATDADANPEDATSLVEEAEESAAEREQEAEDAIILDDTDPEPKPEETPATGESPDETPTTGESSVETSSTGGSPVTAEDETETTGPGGSGHAETPPEESDPNAANEDGDGAGRQRHEDAPSSGSETAANDVASESKWPNDPEPADSSGQSEGETDTGAASVREPTGESAFEFDDEEVTNQSPGDPSSGITSAGPIDTTAPPDGGLEGVLRCPACDFAVPIAHSANRPGDICPECHAGYLAEER